MDWLTKEAEHAFDLSPDISKWESTPDVNITGMSCGSTLRLSRRTQEFMEGMGGANRQIEAAFQHLEAARLEEVKEQMKWHCQSFKEETGQFWKGRLSAPCVPAFRYG